MVGTHQEANLTQGARSEGGKPVLFEDSEQRPQCVSQMVELGRRGGQQLGFGGPGDHYYCYNNK